MLAANVIVADVICQTAGEHSFYSGKTKYRTDQCVPKIEPHVFLRQLNKDSDQTNLNYTPGIYAKGYIVFIFPFVCSFVCS